jgi:hypothetical protein
MIESTEEFIKLRTSTDRIEYCRSIEDTASLQVWIDIITVCPEMKEWVVLNKTIPLEVLRILATDSDSKIRAAVADKRKLDNALFEMLSVDNDELVRQRIAYNKNTPVPILTILAQDKSNLVREAALSKMKNQ